MNTFGLLITTVVSNAKNRKKKVVRKKTKKNVGMRRWMRRIKSMRY
jgi:hypothetical protein